MNQSRPEFFLQWNISSLISHRGEFKNYIDADDIPLDAAAVDVPLPPSSEDQRKKKKNRKRTTGDQDADDVPLDAPAVSRGVEEQTEEDTKAIEELPAPPSPMAGEYGGWAE
ncbi:hypothetical protein FJT64_025118 [Amphibalanus amphitrite]|uniref:Uncharacterized protein n=1 Tax=Amphibalanus amphitrite TaxID=1232801 RepID=A0A6A4WKR2_AMPAM|nr:hypothetical protein FJT64_025118 [Amphibalanus amphitrite]